MRKFVCALALATARGLPALRSHVEKEAIESVAGRRAPLFGGFIIDDDELPCAASGSKCPCEIEKKTINIVSDKSYTCGAKPDNYQTNIFYPAGEACGSNSKDKYPVVFFARGSNGYQAYSNSYNSWLAQVAGQGLVVVAPVTGKAKESISSTFREGCFEDEDLKIAYDFVTGDAKWSAKMDFKSVGLMGHSGGGHHLLRLQSNILAKPEVTSNLRDTYISHVKGIVFSHANKDFFEEADKPDKKATWIPGKTDNIPGPKGRAVPAMFVTSTDDQDVVYHGKVYQAFEYNLKNYTASGGTGTYKTVFVSTQGNHSAPVIPAAAGGAAEFNVWTGRFLYCHLVQDGSGDVCDMIYKGGDGNICKATYGSNKPLLENLCADTGNWRSDLYKCKGGYTGKLGPKCRTNPEH